jgi:glycine hydroxymethyltransferase
VGDVVRRWWGEALAELDPEVGQLIGDELVRQQSTLELIASENLTSRAVLQAQGSVLTNKYAEGYPGHRYYGGCEVVDKVENLAIERAKQTFGAEHANVQPHSGSSANIAVYAALLQPGDTVLAMELAHGGHLTHGSPVNYSGRTYHIVPYHVRRDTETIDFDEVRTLAHQHRPRLIIAGYSAYPRTIDFAAFREIADEVGALLMVDMAHIAGLVAADVHPSPIPYADVVTTTTHKTLAGPRSGVILCRKEHARAVDQAVFPGLQGGPLEHVIAAKAVCFKVAQSEAFKALQRRVVANAKVLAAALAAGGLRIVSGGTDVHLALVDLRGTGLTGLDCQRLLERVRITVNRNAVPFDTAPHSVAGGMRVGSAAVTTRGFTEADMEETARLVLRAVAAGDDESVLDEVEHDVLALMARFPVYDVPPSELP